MRITPGLLMIGVVLIFWASAGIAIFLPWATMDPGPSDVWLPWSQDEEAGSRLYVDNGCSYCHSQFVRTIDWGLGAERIAQAGDYHNQRIILGTERTGPDLSQAGGEHNDDWHLAHFADPRTTRPLSLMPSWEFLGDEKIRLLTAFIQSRLGTDARRRMERQRFWQEQANEAWQKGPDHNIRWLHDQVPQVWREMPNPYPATPEDLARGKAVYQAFCINCHGAMGDGQGPAAKYFKNSPPPLNFTTLRGHLVDNKYIGGILYYQIMNGITGTAMPYFKRELESSKIWNVSNYIAAEFIGYTDADLPPRGIDASYEPQWVNPYSPPATQRGNP